MITIEISPGELVDRLTILTIKMRQIEDEDKIKNISYECAETWNSYHRLQDKIGLNKATEISHYYQKLYETNLNIWQLEEELRSFGSNIPQDRTDIAFDIAETNDKRARLKRQINECVGSKLIEEKSYIG